MFRATTFALTAAMFAAPGARDAHAWGHTGHVFIGQAAMSKLPGTLPLWLRNSYAIAYIGELAAEADVSKSSGDNNGCTFSGQPTSCGNVHDFERDQGHFIDVDDNGYVQPTASFPVGGAPGSVLLSSLLTTSTSSSLVQGRRDFDSLLRASSGITTVTSQPTQYTGYLPFNMVDHWQQIRKDFAYVRAFSAASTNPNNTPADRAFFTAQLKYRQTITLRDIGYWAHFVGDASQPMHVSVHFNGWNGGTTYNFPNPLGYTTSGIHAAFEGQFVKANIGFNDILSRVTTYNAATDACAAKLAGSSNTNCAGIEARVKWYLAQTLLQVIPTYQLTKTLLGGASTGNPWTTTTDPAAKAFVADRVAAGAQEMRDEIVDAWNSSATIFVGFPLRSVASIESGQTWTASQFAGD